VLLPHEGVRWGFPRLLPNPRMLLAGILQGDGFWRELIDPDQPSDPSAAASANSGMAVRNWSCEPLRMSGITSRPSFQRRSKRLWRHEGVGLVFPRILANSRMLLQDSCRDRMGLENSSSHQAGILANCYAIAAGYRKIHETLAARRGIAVTAAPSSTPILMPMKALLLAP